MGVGVFILKKGQYGEVCVFASNLCKYYLRKVDFFVLSLASVRRVFLMWWCVVLQCFVTMVECVVVRLVFMFCSGVFISADVCCVSSGVENKVLLEYVDMMDVVLCYILSMCLFVVDMIICML